MSRKDFKQWPLNDLYHIQERLQEYDPDLYILWNGKTGEHLIMDGLMNVAVMKIPQKGFEVLDSRVVAHIKRIHTANGFSASKEIEKHEATLEREEQRKLDDIAQDFAKESKEAFNNAYNYGRVDGVQKYVQGVSV
jgi:hypothetical protein